MSGERRFVLEINKIFTDNYIVYKNYIKQQLRKKGLPKKVDFINNTTGMLTDKVIFRADAQIIGQQRKNVKSTVTDIWYLQSSFATKKRVAIY